MVLFKVIISPLCIVLIYLLWKRNLTLWALPIAAFLVFYYAMLPGIARGAVRGFNRQAILLLTRGRASEVPALVKRSFFLRMTAPLGRIDSKLALAYLTMEQYDTALTHFENALPYADVAERPTLMVGWVKALFATGNFRRSESEGQNILDRFTKLPELLAVVARSRFGIGKNDDGTRLMLDEAESLSPSEDDRLMITLTRIETAIAAGRKVPPLADDADSNRKLVRAWIHLVRGMLRDQKGDTKKAAQSFEKAKAELPRSFISAEADRRLAALGRVSEEKDETLSKQPTLPKQPTTSKPAATKVAEKTAGSFASGKPKGKSAGSSKKKKKRR